MMQCFAWLVMSRVPIEVDGHETTMYLFPAIVVTLLHLNHVAVVEHEMVFQNLQPLIVKG